MSHCLFDDHVLLFPLRGSLRMLHRMCRVYLLRVLTSCSIPYLSLQFILLSHNTIFILGT
ncbi:hypothetical protein BJX99DRAFT_235233 [Aspergillus californicus]